MKRFFLKILAVALCACSTMLAQTGAGAKHPVASFSLHISTPEAVVKAGAAVPIDIVITNTSDHEIAIGRSNGPMQGEFHHELHVLDSSGKAVARTKWGHKLKGEVGPGEDSVITFSDVIGTLQPGQTLKDGLFANAIFDLTHPGKYTLQIERIDADTKAVVKSNVITVTVTP